MTLFTSHWLRSLRVLYTAYLSVHSPLTISPLYRCVCSPSFCVFLVGFLTFSRLFTWCLVAGKTSLTPSHVRHSLCSNPGTKTRSSTIVSAISLRIQSSSCLSCFRSSMTSLSRRACRHLAGSGSALQVKVGTEGLKQCS